MRESVHLHDVLHGFRAGKGTGMVIVELDMEQELASVDQDLMFLVFLYLQKSYNNIDHGRLLTTLEGYGAGPHMCWILEVFCNQQEVVTHQNGYHNQHFKETQGTNQGGIILPTLFNLIVNNVVQNWLVIAVEYQLVAQEVLVLVVWRCLVLFYNDNDMVGLRDPEWLQVALKVLIGLFHRYRLVENATKSKAMTCQPGTHQSIMLEEAVGQQCTDMRLLHCEWLIRWISCPYFGVELT